ncbi:MAG: hypothetical protein OXB93_04150 [Cytophagales bacterium]|nr:hypothetical protein [Cytophagales bacterium]
MATRDELINSLNRFARFCLPHAAVIGFFWILTACYFYPIVFERKTLHQPDIAQHVGTSRKILEEGKAENPPLWTPYIFGGMPTYLISVPWSTPVISTLQQIFSFGLPHPTWIFFTCMLCTYILCLSLGIRWEIAVLGALIFSFSSYHTVGFIAGHNARLAAIAYLPLILSGLHLVYGHRRYGWGSMVLLLGLAWQIKSNHFQISYYTLLIAVIYLCFQVYQTCRERSWILFIRASGITCGIVIISVGALFAPLATVYEHSQHTIRGERILSPRSGEKKQGLDKEYAFQYSYSLWEPLTLLIPNFYGGASRESLPSSSHTARAFRDKGFPDRQIAQVLSQLPLYWGQQPITTPYYAGVLAVLLAIWAGWTCRSPHTIWLLSSFLFFLLISWGKHVPWFSDILFDHLPGYDKFRSVGFALVVPILSLILWGSLGLEAVFRTGFSRKDFRNFLKAVLMLGGFFLLCWLFSGMGTYRSQMDGSLLRAGYPDWFLEALRMDRQSRLDSDALRGLGFLLGLGIVFSLLYLKKIPVWGGLVILAALCLADMIGVNLRYLNSDMYQKDAYTHLYKSSEADKRILSDTVPYARTFFLPNPFTNSQTSYYHRSIGGYHPAKLRRYQDLIEYHLNPIREQILSGKSSGTEFSVLNMLNARYLLRGHKASDVFINENALGNAWWASSLHLVRGPEEEIRALADLRPGEVVVDTTKYPLSAIPWDTTGVLKVVNYGVNEISYEAEVPSNHMGLAVFSEIFYPEWRAYIDEKEVPVFRVNYLLRAVLVPGGYHRLSFRIKGNVYEASNRVSLFFNYLVLILLIIACGLGWFGKKTWKKWI